MLLYHLFAFGKNICNGVVWISLLAFASAAYAYSVDLRRSADDPKKKNWHPATVFFVPFTWPVFLLAFALLSLLRFFLFILRAVVYGVFLTLFAFALVGVRKPFILKILNFIGDKLLAANALLMNLFLRPWSNEPQTT